MKKSIFVFVFLLFSFHFFYAQTVRIGPKIGLNIADLSGNVNSDVRSLAGLHVGGIVEVEVMDWFSIQPELLYSVHGYRLGETTGTNNYISLPIMARFFPIEGLYGEVGPQLGFLIAANEKNQTNKVSVTQSYKTVDMGLSFGAGYILRDLGLGFGIRYYAGLSTVFTDNTRIKNGVFQLSATWAFVL
ncbi:porin family protein [Croceitalea vernalis]|uniref:Porin family protein n=1 Tax=Croceitalea vernalis TaxID=3075599 RepID=A0ABU3BJF0_9FLAO|nr:porin family protein [Croceitalea sp. P007]MDT0622274.1 porin family protein [Croceitalea sp. P007]